MSHSHLRARVITFIAVLLALAVCERLGLLSDPWPLVIGCVTYLIVVLPAIAK